MVCNECGKNAATLHFTKVVKGEKTEWHLCENCAREKGEHFLPGNGFSIHHLLSGLMNFEQSTQSSGYTRTTETLRCPNCGLTYRQFAKMGRFGCSQCYEAFGEHLDPLFRRIHGGTRHIGKVPKRAGGDLETRRQVERLKEQLQDFVRREEFEQAAQTRDRIREIEQKLHG